jgi:hypothetical protein
MPEEPIENKIKAALAGYTARHPDAEISAYRQNNVSVRVRVIDPSFARMSKSARSKKIWPFLEKLPDDVQDDITMLLLLTPEEVKTSFANLEFDDPTPSRL